MYYTGYDPLTMQRVYVPKTYEEKAMQRALLQYRDPKNYALVRKALRLAHREDLIGYDRRCLVPPEPAEREKGNRRRPGGAAQRPASKSAAAPQGKKTPRYAKKKRLQSGKK